MSKLAGCTSVPLQQHQESAKQRRAYQPPCGVPRPRPEILNCVRQAGARYPVCCLCLHLPGSNSLMVRPPAERCTRLLQPNGAKVRSLSGGPQKRSNTLPRLLQFRALGKDRFLCSQSQPVRDVRATSLSNRLVQHSAPSVWHPQKCCHGTTAPHVMGHWLGCSCRPYYLACLGRFLPPQSSLALEVPSAHPSHTKYLDTAAVLAAIPSSPLLLFQLRWRLATTTTPISLNVPTPGCLEGHDSFLTTRGRRW